jgi:hypothetical protein
MAVTSRLRHVRRARAGRNDQKGLSEDAAQKELT